MYFSVFFFFFFYSNSSPAIATITIFEERYLVETYFTYQLQVTQKFFSGVFQYINNQTLKKEMENYLISLQDVVLSESLTRTLKNNIALNLDYIESLANRTETNQVLVKRFRTFLSYITPSMEHFWFTYYEEDPPPFAVFDPLQKPIENRMRHHLGLDEMFGLELLFNIHDLYVVNSTELMSELELLRSEERDLFEDMMGFVPSFKLSAGIDGMARRFYLVVKLIEESGMHRRLGFGEINGYILLFPIGELYMDNSAELFSELEHLEERDEFEEVMGLWHYFMYVFKVDVYGERLEPLLTLIKEKELPHRLGFGEVDEVELLFLIIDLYGSNSTELMSELGVLNKREWFQEMMWLVQEVKSMYWIIGVADQIQRAFHFWQWLEENN